MLAALVDRVARRLRAGERIGRTFTLRLRFDDYTRATRSATIPGSSGATATWLEVGRRVLREARPLIEERGCTLLGITISGLTDARSEQLEDHLDGDPPQPRQHRPPGGTPPRPGLQLQGPPGPVMPDDDPASALARQLEEVRLKQETRNERQVWYFLAYFLFGIHFLAFVMIYAVHHAK